MFKRVLVFCLSYYIRENDKILEGMIFCCFFMIKYQKNRLINLIVDQHYWIFFLLFVWNHFFFKFFIPVRKNQICYHLQDLQSWFQILPTKSIDRDFIILVFYLIFCFTFSNISILFNALRFHLNFPIFIYLSWYLQKNHINHVKDYLNFLFSQIANFFPHSFHYYWNPFQNFYL